MAVGEALRTDRGKLDDGTSVVDKRHYGRSRKTRVRPASIADELPPPLPAPSSTADITVSQQATAPTTAPASALPRPESEPPPPSLPAPSPTFSSAESATTSGSNRSSVRKSSSTAATQQPCPPTTTTAREDRPQSNTQQNRRRHHRGDEGGRRNEGYSTRDAQAPHRSSRGSDNPRNSSLPGQDEHRRRRSSRQRSRGYSSAADELSQTPGAQSPTSATHKGDSYNSGGGSSGRSSPGGTATSSSERESHGRYERHRDRHDGRSSYSKRRSKDREEASEDDRSRCHRGGEKRRSYPRREERVRRRSKDGRSYGSKRSSYAGKGGRDTRHHSDSQPHSRHHQHHRRHRHRDDSSSNSSGGSSGSMSSSSSSSQRYISQDERGGPTARNGRTRRGGGKKREKTSNRNHTHGGRRGQSRADTTANERRHERATTGRGAAGEKHVAIEPAKASDMKISEKQRRRSGVAREDSNLDVLISRRELRKITIKAVVTVQRLFRGYLARNRVAGRREAMAFLRSACLGVAMDMIDSYIREDIAPRMIYGILAKGFQGAGAGAAQRAEAVAAANTLLEETSVSMVRQLVTLALTEEANSHLDAVFVRDRRNPLLATVDDVVAETLRKWMREAVVEAVKEGAEDFLFGRRISELVEDVVEEGMVEAVRPIAAEVFFSAIALAAFSEVEGELCIEEAKLVVAETMAPFEDQLVELQREKDVAAIQAAAHHVMIKGLQLQHAARTVGQRGKLVVMSDINGKTLNLLLAGRFLAILRAAETNRDKVSTSPLLFMLFRRLVVRTGRSVLLEELARELDRDESALHELELERMDELDRHRRRAGPDLSTA